MSLHKFIGAAQEPERRAGQPFVVDNQYSISEVEAMGLGISIVSGASCKRLEKVLPFQTQTRWLHTKTEHPARLSQRLRLLCCTVRRELDERIRHIKRPNDGNTC